MREASQVYTRFAFFFGFSTASSAALYLLCKLLAVPTDALWSGTALHSLPFGTKIIFGVGPLAAGFVTGVFCAAIAASREKKNVRLESFVGSLWHYSSTGVLAWTVLSIFQLVVAYGGSIAIQNFPAKKATLLIVASGAISGALIFLIVRTAGELRQRGHHKLESHLLRFGPLAVGVATGVLQSLILHISWWPGIIAGILFPYVLIPWAQTVCLRDGLR
jgi:hypothetical protein